MEVWGGRKGWREGGGREEGERETLRSLLVLHSIVTDMTPSSLPPSLHPSLPSSPSLLPFLPPSGAIIIQFGSKIYNACIDRGLTKFTISTNMPILHTQQYEQSNSM